MSKSQEGAGDRGLVCYVCTAPCTLEDVTHVDCYFEKIPTAKYTFLIDFLGLHHCSGEESLFHEGVTNVCKRCLRRAIQAYDDRTNGGWLYGL